MVRTRTTSNGKQGKLCNASKEIMKMYSNETVARRMNEDDTTERARNPLCRRVNVDAVDV